MLNHLVEERRLDDGSTRPLASPAVLQDVRFVNGRPRWRLAHGDVVLEKSIVMPHRQNTTHVSYRLAAGIAVRSCWCSSPRSTSVPTRARSRAWAD